MTDLCNYCLQELGHVPIIAEDLGVITADVNELRKAIGAPGMVVLQFAWGSGATNTHLPHNHYENCVCYPGGPTALLPAFNLLPTYYGTCDLDLEIAA